MKQLLLSTRRPLSFVIAISYSPHFARYRTSDCNSCSPSLSLSESDAVRPARSAAEREGDDSGQRSRFSHLASAVGGACTHRTCGSQHKDRIDSAVDVSHAILSSSWFNCITVYPIWHIIQLTDSSMEMLDVISAELSFKKEKLAGSVTYRCKGDK